MDKTKITSHDVEKVADKLEHFAKTLSKQEQDVLGWVLTRAQTAPPPDQAAKALAALPHEPRMKTPIASDLARAVGLGPNKAAAVTVVVGWTYRFGREFGPQELIDPAIKPSGGG